MLIQATVRTKYLKALDKQAVQYAFAKFKAHFNNPAIQENIRNSKEEQYQEGFLNDLFVDVLGYTKNPSENYNLTTEYRNVKDSKKADGAIVVNGVVKGVIELKGTNIIDLGQAESQAFGYKNNQPECVYVITSNFEKLRFYIDNAIEYIEFNLFTLTEKDFELLYLCLAYSQIEKDIPKKIKDESISHEEDITKQLYKDYSLFKRELHADLVDKNPDYDNLLLFRKTQKLLSRFLFLFFAEDRQLLPPNSVRLILNQWVQLKELDEYNPLYNRFKKYFGYLNTGYKGKQFDVFAYNGGLFKPDAVLDSVKIDDDILFKNTLKLSEYDFASEVDVNILGHIFENSLNELDELKAELSGEIIDKSKTKRKKDGIFYTPKYITKYIIDNTVGRLCIEKKADFGIYDEDYTTDRKRTKTEKQLLVEKLINYREWLLQITICDPACGSGAFLNQALNFLIDEHRYIDELQAKLFGDSLVLSDIENTILENNLFGVDINEESVEIARLSLWLRTAQPNRKLNDLSKNIKCGNSLIDDPAIAGEKAFNWENEFPQVFGREQKTDMIIVPDKNETPDYLQLVQDKLLASQLKAEQALELSKEAIEISKEAYKYARKLETVSEPHVKYHERKFGFDVVIGNPPYGATFSEDNKKYFISRFKISPTILDTYVLFMLNSMLIIKEKGLLGFIIPSTWLYMTQYSEFRVKLVRNYQLSEIRLYRNAIFEEATVETCIALLKNNIPLVDSLYNYKEINGLDVLNDISVTQKTILKDTNVSLMLKNISIDNLFQKISKNISLDKYAKIICGLTPYRLGKGNPKQTQDIVENRLFDANNKKDETYRQYLMGRDFNRYTWQIEQVRWISYGDWLAEPRYAAPFDEPQKIVIRQTSDRIIAQLDTNKYVSLKNVHNLEVVNSEIDYKFLLSVLNSKLIDWWYQQLIPEKGRVFAEVKVINLKKLPIKIAIDQQPFIANADLMLSLNKELQELSGKFQRNLKREFAFDTLSAKLQNWHTMIYAEFIKELEKLKVKLTLHQKAEWESYFQLEVEKVHAIEDQINKTDREIDQLVYTLYGLSKEEIKIIEQLK